MTLERVVTLKGKGVLPSDPYAPSEERISQFVGREREMKLIAAAWLGSRTALPMAPLLIGEPGVGKNRLVYELAERTGRDLYIFQGHEDVTAEDLACAVRFSDEPGVKMEYMISPLVTAMHNGGICFIDEIGKIRPRALALLVSVLDERRYIDSTLLGERVVAHPNFRFIAATNSGEINALPEFIRSRMRPVIEVGYPTKEEIDQIVKRQYGLLGVLLVFAPRPLYASTIDDQQLAGLIMLTVCPVTYLGAALLVTIGGLFRDAAGGPAGPALRAPEAER